MFSVSSNVAFAIGLVLWIIVEVLIYIRCEIYLHNWEDFRDNRLEGVWIFIKSSIVVGIILFFLIAPPLFKSKPIIVIDGPSYFMPNFRK